MDIFKISRITSGTHAHRDIDGFLFFKISRISSGTHAHTDIGGFLFFKISRISSGTHAHTDIGGFFSSRSLTACFTLGEMWAEGYAIMCTTIPMIRMSFPIDRLYF